MVFGKDANMMRRALPTLVLSIGLIGGAAGCGAGGIEARDSFTVQNPLKVTPERPLADVPVPSGFAYKSNGSYVFSGNYRVAKLLYRGTPKLDDCVSYFKTQMPLSRWAFVKDNGTDERELVFQNESAEEMLVSMKRSAGITSLEIAIKPRRV
jgi:hypothetical protein